MVVDKKTKEAQQSGGHVDFQYVRKVEKILDIASDTYEVDHPLCENCLHLVLQDVQQQATAVRF